MEGSPLLGLLPSWVVVAEDVPKLDLSDLFEAELAHIAQAPGRRQAEFATARLCASRALQALGRPRPPMLPDEAGCPPWPEGVVGSMTHSAQLCAAAVSDSPSIVSLGIDLEDLPGAPLHTLDATLLPQERAGLKDLHATLPQGIGAQVIFSAKESLYKAWYPLERRWLDFDEALIRLRQVGPRHGTFEVTLLTDFRARAAWREHADGRWAVDARQVATAIVMRTSSP